MAIRNIPMLNTVMSFILAIISYDQIFKARVGSRPEFAGVDPRFLGMWFKSKKCGRFLNFTIFAHFLMKMK